MKRYPFPVLLLALSLAACGGIPLRSMPKLIALQTELLQANPAEFVVAVQVDSRIVPPNGAAPLMSLTITPREPDAFEPIARKLPMRIDSASVTSLGLSPTTTDRRWLIYSFPPESQIELSRLQTFFKKLKAGNSGGSIAVGISQENLASRDPALRNTSWESWLRTSREQGFFEMWSGTLEKLLQQAQSARQSG